MSMIVGGDASAVTGAADPTTANAGATIGGRPPRDAPVRPGRSAHGRNRHCGAPIDGLPEKPGFGYGRTQL